MHVSSRIGAVLKDRYEDTTVRVWRENEQTEVYTTM